MTTQEREMLEGFLKNLRNAAIPHVDPEADGMIQNAIAGRPDLSYLLVQQALVQQLALRDAQAQIAQLLREINETRSSAPASSSSFLGGIPAAAAPSGRGGWQASPPSAPQAGWGQSAPAASAPTPGPATPGSGFSSFLRSAATTAAGVAGGALLFEGIEGLMGHHSGGFGAPGFGGAGFGGAPTAERIENTTIINEYGDTATPNAIDVDDEQDGESDDLGDADGGDDGQWV